MGAACDRQFNWRVGTPFFAVKSTATVILSALLRIREGAPGLDLINELVASHGMSRTRAQHLVVALLDLAVLSVQERHGNSSDQVELLKGDLRSIAEARRAEGAKRVSRSRWVAAFFLSAFLVDQPDASMAAHHEERVTAWKSNRKTIELICPRKAG
jgi:hypothetical protein